MAQSPVRHRIKWGEALLVLERRCAFLRDRIADRQARRPGSEGYDLNELRAITLAISCIDDAWARERKEEEVNNANTTDQRSSSAR